MSREKEKNSQKSPGSPLTHDWMLPVKESQPCGVDLEYDPEFVVLGTAVATRSETQYGDFVGVPEPVNWTDVERDCRRLMMRSKDIRLAVLYARCCTRVRAATGLAEGLALLAAWLEAWPDLIHPQPDVDEDREAALEIRMNAVQSLTDTDGLLSDLRDIALTRSTATRLQVRDVERAFAYPRVPDALAQESVARQLEELRQQQPSLLAGFDDALKSVTRIEAWCVVHLGVHLPDLSALTRMLGPLVARRTDIAIESVEADEEEPAVEEVMASDQVLNAGSSPSASRESIDTPAAAMRPIGTVMDRHGALGLIRQARAWFEHHEPSSPLPVLLRRAERFVGRPYGEVIKAIPAELLAQWEGEE